MVQVVYFGGAEERLQNFPARNVLQGTEHPWIPIQAGTPMGKCRLQY
jgi:hypothetical protein